MSATPKPIYRVPTMDEIAALPPSGHKVASTFSGCGGSCLGYRMAAMDVRYALEFIPSAQETYKLNHPNSFLDTRDIRTVSVDDVLDALNMKPGELDVFDGSPPCASFSTSGARAKMWGEVKSYSDTKQRTDDLFLEYVRLIKGLQPKVFIAENVSGLVKGVAKGFFKIIFQQLEDCGYQVGAALIDSKWCGVPQARQRIIFMGVRNDLKMKPVFPKPLPYFYTVRDALPWIEEVKFGGAPMNYKTSDLPSPTIMQSDAARLESAYLSGGGWCHAQPGIVEAESSMEGFAVGAEWENLAPGETSKRFFQLKRAPLDAPSQTITQRGGDASCASVSHPLEKRKFSIAELRRICGFPDDFQLAGTFAQKWERLGRAVPPLMMKAIAETVKTEILDKLRK